MAICYSQIYDKGIADFVFLNSGSPDYYSNTSLMEAKVMNYTRAFLRICGIHLVLSKENILLAFSGENLRYPLISEPT